MANEDHVARLKQGVVAWNAWRAKNQNEFPDLSGAILHDADLRGADLHEADLRHADLRRIDLRSTDLRLADLSNARLHGADLRHADLRRTCLAVAACTGNLSHAVLASADLHRADLQGANLSNAVLIHANLFKADLRGANLRNAALADVNMFEADLHGANLTGADLSYANLTLTNLVNTILFNANLSNATLDATVFTETDLGNVIGLDKCVYSGPSRMDFRTLQRTPNLPLVFLRGVGLPDGLIDYLPSLLHQAIQFYSCFISYSAKDRDFAERLHADLQNKGVRCWFAPHDLPIGAKILDGLDEAIRLRDKVLLILSEHSIRSDWVEDEVTTAFEEERNRGQPMLFPIRLDDTVMATQEPWAAKLRARNIGDFRHWKDHDSYVKGLDRMLRDLAMSDPKSPD